MCILFIALEQHPKYPLIVCANRDEFHFRPTEPAHFWQSAQGSNSILAGKDLQAGGTWLGVNKQGGFAAITNRRVAMSHTQAEARSRGELVLKALESHTHIQDWLAIHSADYNPFNLVFSNAEQLYCYDSQSKERVPLTKGFHSISNGALDDIWPKMARGTLALEHLISTGDEPDIDALLQIMKDETRAHDNELPQTGITLEWERLLSSIYIKHEEYGTRSTSIILQDELGNTHFIEVRYDGKGRTLGRQDFLITAP